MFTQCFFSRSSNLTEIVSQKVSESSKSILIAMYTLTDPNLVQSLKDAKRKGIDIYAIFDQEQLLNYKDILTDLINSEINFKTIGKSAARMHHKFLVIDGIAVITGSFNWTIQADRYNFENIIIIQDEDIAQRYFNEFDSIWYQITSKNIITYLGTEHSKIEADDVDYFISTIHQKLKHQQPMSHQKEIPIELRDAAISKVYEYRHNGNLQKAIRILDYLLYYDPNFIVAKTLRDKFLTNP